LEAKRLLGPCLGPPQFSVLNPKFIEEISPQSGRKNLAHGVSRGSESLPHPHPLSRSGGRGVPKAG